MSAPKLHNAMWPGLVGKGTDEGQEPPISLERMLELTAAAEVNGQKFDGIDYFLFLPHTDPQASDDELKNIADLIAGKGFDIGSLVAPVWPGTIGDSAMGDAEQRGKFLDAVKWHAVLERFLTNMVLASMELSALTLPSLASRNGEKIPKAIPAL